MSWRGTGSRCATIAPRRSRLLDGRFADLASELGLRGAAELRYRPRTSAGTAAELAAELAERADSDLERGFTGHGPHRDDFVLARDGRELRAYGSQGEQRIALLALLMAERDALADVRAAPPLLLLDDVMSELDESRRELLVERLGSGQSVITTTELAHVPGAGSASSGRGRRRRRSQQAVRHERVPEAHVSRRRARSLTAGGGMSRRAPRPVALGVSSLVDGLAPLTLLAEVQRLWPAVVGDAVAAQATPTADRGGSADRDLQIGGLGAGARPDGPDCRRASQRSSRP